ncbi:MAG: hypothetical protein IPH44_41125 [Myxococcales bacterium]|nr:hypothetical protein [Myxococcales bacterium]
MSDPREGNADQDTALARQALAQRDLPHALHHIGCALTHDPMHRERMAVLNEIIAAAPDPMALVRLEGDVSFVDAANKSYVLAWMRRWSEAMDLITDVAEIRPDIPYMLWCEWWMSQPGVLASIPLDEIIGGIVVDILKIASKCPIPTGADDPRKPTLESGARILAAIRQLHPAEGMLWFGSSMVARRIGATGEALQFAQHAYQIDPSWKAAVGVANALRDAKRLDEAAQWFAQAIEHDPQDVSAHLDCGDMMLDADRLADAQRQYEAATGKEPDHPWATASLLYLRYLGNKDAATKLALLRLTEAEPPNHRAEELYEKLDPPRLFINRLPPPRRRLGQRAQRDLRGDVRQPGPAPRLDGAAQAVPRRVAERGRRVLAADGDVGPAGRLRLPGRDHPAARPAPAQGPGAVPDLAVGRHPAQARHRAAELPDRHRDPQPGQRAVRARRVDADRRAHRGQAGRQRRDPRAARHAGVPAAAARLGVAGAAVGAARADRDDPDDRALRPAPPWQGSPRQQALYGLLYGPSDWTTGAAIIALGVLARRDPAIRAEVVQAFGWLFQQIPREGFCCWEAPLVVTWLTFPDVDDVTKQRLTEYKARIFDNKTGGSSVRMIQLEAKFDMAAEVQAAQAAQQQLATGGGGDPDRWCSPARRSRGCPTT